MGQSCTELLEVVPSCTTKTKNIFFPWDNPLGKQFSS